MKSFVLSTNDIPHGVLKVHDAGWASMYTHFVLKSTTSDVFLAGIERAIIAYDMLGNQEQRNSSGAFGCAFATCKYNVNDVVFIEVSEL